MEYRIIQLNNAVILGKAPRSLISANWCPSLPELSLLSYLLFIQELRPPLDKEQQLFNGYTVPMHCRTVGMVRGRVELASQWDSQTNLMISPLTYKKQM